MRRTERIVLAGQVEQFKADPVGYVNHWSRSQDVLTLARVLNAAGFYSRALDTTRWTSQWARRLVWRREEVAVQADLRAYADSEFRDQFFAPKVDEHKAARYRFHQGQPVFGFGCFVCPGKVLHVLGRFVAIRWADQARASIYDAKTAEKMLRTAEVRS